jgi:hypothetical protein
MSKAGYGWRIQSLQQTSNNDRSQCFFLPDTCPRVFKKKKKNRQLPKKVILALPDTIPDSPGGQADTIWLRNQAMTAALIYSQVGRTCVPCMLLSSYRQLWFLISRFQHALQPSNELFSPSSANAQLTTSREHISAATATIESDSEIEIVGCKNAPSCHKSEEAR